MIAQSHTGSATALLVSRVGFRVLAFMKIHSLVDWTRERCSLLALVRRETRHWGLARAGVGGRRGRGHIRVAVPVPGPGPRDPRDALGGFFLVQRERC